MMSTAQPVTSAPGGGNGVFALRDGRLLIVCGEKGVRMFRFDRRKLTVVGRCDKINLRFWRAGPDGRVFLCSLNENYGDIYDKFHIPPDQRDSPGVYVELTGIDDALASARSGR